MLEKVYCEQYGYINYRLIGIVDYRKMLREENFENMLKWNKIFRIMIYFNAYLIKYLEEPEKVFYKSYAVFIPIIEDNKLWVPSEHNEYYEHWIKPKTRKTLPIVEDINKIEKWQKSWSDILIPDYFDKVDTMEELIHYFNMDVK